MVYGTFVGGLIVHFVTVIPWLCGGILAAMSPVAFLNGYMVSGSILLGLVSLQYLIRIPHWPAFAQWLKKMNPRAYYKRCSISRSLPDIKKENTLLCYHPHGILCIGFSWNGAHSPELGPLFEWLIVDVLCKAPLFGWIVAWCGNMNGAGAPTMQRLMKSGRNIALIPGGFEEATLQERGIERVVIKNRKGFIKYALQYGYTVHPVYSFGECDSYVTMPHFQKLRLALNRYKIPTVFFWGATFMPLFPRTDIEVYTVIGEGIKFPKTANEKITTALVDEWHGKYVAGLVAVFEKHKAEVGKSHLNLDVR